MESGNTRKPSDFMKEMDEIFAEPGCVSWEHRTLRTIFDPYSGEWKFTTPEEKIAILKKLVDNDVDLSFLGVEYEEYYLLQGRKDIAKCLNNAYGQLLEMALKQM